MQNVLKCIVSGIALLLLAGCAAGLVGAARNGDVAALQKLLDAGADINESGLSGNCNGPALAHAAYYCHPEAVRYLVKRGADIEAVGAMMGGNRPLHLAAGSDCVEAVQILLDGGADLHARAMRGSALSVAAIEGNIKTVKYLITRGADVDDAVTTLQKRGEKKALALLEKYAQPALAAGSRGKAPAAKPIRSDIDAVPAFTAAPRPDDYAVVIGVERYQGLPPSDFSKNDAVVFSRYLQALGYPARNIELVTDDKATKSAIEKALEAWLVNHAKKGSRIIVYFSGHGAPEPATGEAYLVPYDGDPNYLPQTGYPLKRLYEQLANLPSREMIVVLDSCFSGMGGRSVLAKGARPLVMTAPTMTLPTNAVVLTASEAGQISTSSPDKGHGVFTYYFLKALKDGRKNIAEIYETIKPQVQDEARRLNVRQNPTISPAAEALQGRFAF
ncbi:MAG: caspase family protein [Smithellaceae bacterium]|nr:caspase family protein [Syntrophaceae bacterium]MDD4241292.1 caspase family protein [Smithellaceae bacterium]NLX52950.1 peptidase C14 [Deltaproteobacteria bacterium]